MSAPDIFLILTLSDRPVIIEALQKLSPGSAIYQNDYDETIIEGDTFEMTFADFDLNEYILFSRDHFANDRIFEIFQRLDQPCVCRITTRSLGKMNELVVALYERIDFVMDDDNGHVIDREAFRKYLESGTDWLRLPLG